MLYATPGLLPPFIFSILLVLMEEMNSQTQEDHLEKGKENHDIQMNEKEVDVPIMDQYPEKTNVNVQSDKKETESDHANRDEELKYNNSIEDIPVKETQSIIQNPSVPIT